MKAEAESIFKEFVLNRALAPSSIRLYRIALQKYVDFTCKPLEELIDEADLEEDDGIRLRKRKVRKYLIDFKEDLTNNGLSVNYISHTLTLVKSFYHEFDIQLPRTYRRQSRSDKRKETIIDDLPTIDEIKKAVDYANTTYKSIILLGVSSGMSRAEIISLTFKHYYDAVPLRKYPKTISEVIGRVGEIGNLIPLWKVVGVKTGHPYFTFSSPEASDAILEYLKELHRTHPEYNPKLDDTFFRNNNVPISNSAVSEMYRRINQKAGLRKVGERILVRPHSLRKYFATTLERNKFPHLMTRWLLGHSIDKTTDAYFKADSEALKEEYKNVLNQLSIEKVKGKSVTTMEYDQLLQELRNKDKEQKYTKEKVERLEKLVASLVKYQTKDKSKI
jgi:integrase